MSDQRSIVLLIKGALSEETPEVQAEAQQLIADIKALREQHPRVYPVAIALIGAELADEP